MYILKIYTLYNLSYHGPGVIIMIKYYIVTHSLLMDKHIQLINLIQQKI